MRATPAVAALAGKRTDFDRTGSGSTTMSGSWIVVARASQEAASNRTADSRRAEKAGRDMSFPNLVKAAAIADFEGQYP
jgi:hypothetical protein